MKGTRTIRARAALDPLSHNTRRLEYLVGQDAQAAWRRLRGDSSRGFIPGEGNRPNELQEIC